MSINPSSHSLQPSSQPKPSQPPQGLPDQNPINKLSSETLDVNTKPPAIFKTPSASSFSLASVQNSLKEMMQRIANFVSRLFCGTSDSDDEEDFEDEFLNPTSLDDNDIQKEMAEEEKKLLTKEKVEKKEEIKTEKKASAANNKVNNKITALEQYVAQWDLNISWENVEDLKRLYRLQSDIASKKLELEKLRKEKVDSHEEKDLIDTRISILITLCSDRQQQLTSNAKREKEKIAELFSSFEKAFGEKPNVEDYQIYQMLSRYFGELEIIKKGKNDDARIAEKKGDALVRHHLAHLGIQNIGNSCYMNSELQSLFYIRPFYKIIKHSEIKQRTIPKESDKEFAHRKAIKQALVRVLETMEEGLSDEKSPASVKKREHERSEAVRSLKNAVVKSNFSKEISQEPNQQHDSVEFYNLLCEVIDFGPMQITRKTTIKEKPVEFSTAYSFPCLDLPVEPDKNLQITFNHYFKEEKISDQKRSQIQLQNIPQLLVIREDRFHQAARGVVKIQAPIQLPPNDQLQLTSDHCPKIPDKKAAVYQLTSFTVHEGSSAKQGHYVSYNYVDGEWYRHSDDNVTVVSQETVDEQKTLAYKLVFALLTQKKSK